MLWIIIPIGTQQIPWVHCSYLRGPNIYFIDFAEQVAVACSTGQLLTSVSMSTQDPRFWYRDMGHWDLVDVYGKCRYKYTIHGWYGVCFEFADLSNFVTYTYIR